MSGLLNYSVQQFIDDPRKKLLSIDGGGMKGIIPLAMLAYLEEASGKPTYEIFDMVSGTSTGAIITAGLASGYSAKQILQKGYREILPDLFGISTFRKALNFVFSRFNHIYDNKEFIEGLSPLTGGLRMSEVEHIDILITVKDVRTSNTYFITSAGKGADMFKDWPLAGAVAGSTAAPIYFPPIDGNLIDGGVGAFNNPSLVLVTEAMTYLGEEYGYTDGNVILLSLGSGHQNNDIKDGDAAYLNPLSWLKYLVTAQHGDANKLQTYAAQLAYKDRVDMRRYNPSLSVSNLLEIGIAYNDAVEALPKINLATSDEKTLNFMEQVGRAYANMLNWNKSDNMSWDTVGGEARPKVNKQINWKGILP